jgi:hypothetical protein
VISSKELVAVRHIRPGGAVVLIDGREIDIGSHNAKYLGFVQQVQMPKAPRRTAKIMGVSVEVLV